REASGTELSGPLASSSITACGTSHAGWATTDRRWRMLTAEQNELLTLSGPSTPLGELFRRYWIPALMAEELPGLDCVPVRGKLLGEELLAFRDTSGRVGLVDRHCA